MASYPPFQQPITTSAKQVDNPAWRLFFIRLGTLLSGAVTHSTGALIDSHIVVGNGAGDIRVIPGLGTATQVLHGNAGGDPSFSAVSLTADVTGTLPATNGGTGQSTVTQGDLLYGSASNVWSKLAKSTTATRYLANTGTTNNPAWDQVNLANGVTGNLPIANLGNGTFTTVTSSVTGTQNNLNLGVAGNTYCAWSGASDATITGITLGAAGIALLFKNTGTKVAYFPHLNGGSSAGNQFTNLITSSTTPVAPGGWISYMHNGAVWFLTGHDQGAYITPTFAAGDFTLSGDRTWTVDSGDVATYIWKVTGRSMHVVWKLATTTISGGATSGFFQIAIPNAYTPTLGVLSMAAYLLVGATEYVAYANVAASGTVIGVQSVPATADFGTGTNNIYNYGQTWFEIT